MSGYRETRTMVGDVPIRRARPVVETRHDSVVHEARGMSGGTIAALVLASIAVGVLITMLIMNIQQRNSDEQLAQERARSAAAEQAASQPTQQPPIIVTPQTQPGAVPVPVPVPVPAPSQAAPTTATPTNTQLEVEVNSKLLDDQELRAHPLDVKVLGSTAVLSGYVPNDELKARAQQLAMTVKGIRSVMNTIIVKPE
jgi:osmotically-inducible protein OsmY